jgi:hypothetical protein
MQGGVVLVRRQNRLAEAMYCNLFREVHMISVILGFLGYLVKKARLNITITIWLNLWDKKKSRSDNLNR